MKITVNDICDRILQNGYPFVFISGNGGAGKSTLAHSLQDTLVQRNKTVKILSTDDFMLDKAYRKKTMITYKGKNGQIKSCYMASTFRESYDFDSLKQAAESKEADITLIEGIGAALFLQDFKNSYKIFLQVDKDTEYKRRIRRARKGADFTRERAQIRFEQFDVLILPLATQFDMQLISQDDFSFVAVAPRANLISPKKHLLTPPGSIPTNNRQ